MSSQEKGYRTKACLAFEESYKTLPDNVAGFGLPINSNSVAGSRNQTSAETLTGRRDPVEPDEGNLDVGGTLVVPVDAHAFGLYLRAMFAAPVSTVVPALPLGNGPVTDLGSGKVGIPCPGHGLAPGACVIIDGAGGYDGSYSLAAETSVDVLVVSAVYAAANVTDAATATLARQVRLDSGAAVDLGNGLVGLPAAGHGLPVGAEISLAGTANYDGVYTLARGTTSNVLAVTAAFNAENMDGAETVTARFYDHVFTVRDVEMPSFALEKFFPTIPLRLRALGCKIGQLSLNLGGDSELTASLDIKGAAENKAATALDADALSWPLVRFKQFHAAIGEGGQARSGRFTEFQITLGFNLDEDTFTIGDGGERGDLGEGVLALSGSLTGLFKDTRYLDKALVSESTSLAAWLVNGGYGLRLEFEEVKLARTSPKIEGSKGVKESFDWTAYYGSGAGNSSVTATLRNEIKNWEV